MNIVRTTIFFLSATIIPIKAFGMFNTQEAPLELDVTVSEARVSYADELRQLFISKFNNRFNGKKLTIDFNWSAGNVNAYAGLDLEDNPFIKVTAGMAGHRYLTNDGLALILCHEIGHFLGGDPKKLRGNSGKRSWSSAEGQADFYATSDCLSKILFSNKALNTDDEVSQDVMNQVREICKTSICERLALASYSVAKVYADVKRYRYELSLVKPSYYEVYRTNLAHPDPQCRLDTLVAGINSNPRPACWFYSK